MADPKIGLGGHVSYLVLAPKVDHTEKTESRDSAGNIEYVDGKEQNGAILVDRDVMTGETFPTGETNCHAATVAAVNDDGTINAGGWNGLGVARNWTHVVMADQPEAREADPAGHVFHSDCPFGR